MNQIEEKLIQFLKQEGIKEKEFCDNFKMTIPTISKAIGYALEKPDKADWALMFRIKSIYKDFEIEQFKSASLDQYANKGHSEERENTFKKVIGNNLKILRNSRGVTQEDMAKLFGTLSSNYSAIETGRTHLSCYRLHLISEILGVSYQTIIEGQNNKNDPQALEKHLLQKDRIIAEKDKKIELLEKNAELYKSLVKQIKDDSK